MTMRARTLALAGIIAPVWFTALVIVQGLLLPDYSHVQQPISALAARPTGWIQALNFYVTGILMMAFAFALHDAVQATRLGHAGFALLVLGAIGVVLSGIFPWRMIDGVATEPPAHVAAAITTFAATGLGLIVFSQALAGDPRWRDLAPYTMYSGIGVLLLFFIVGAFAIEASSPLQPWTGLIQRGLCAVWFVCVIVLAARLLTGVRGPLTGVDAVRGDQ
jgi:hypothetical membrane protein